ncbi:MAG: DUF1328 domain-containing protein [Pseudobdellovibrionaceae bacterium]
MLYAAITFFIIALVAFVLGIIGVAGVSMQIGTTLLVVFMIFAVISYIFNQRRHKKI